MACEIKNGLEIGGQRLPAWSKVWGSRYNSARAPLGPAWPGWAQKSDRLGQPGPRGDLSSSLRFPWRIRSALAWPVYLTRVPTPLTGCSPRAQQTCFVAFSEYLRCHRQRALWQHRGFSSGPTTDWSLLPNSRLQTEPRLHDAACRGRSESKSPASLRAPGQKGADVGLRPGILVDPGRHPGPASWIATLSLPP